MNRMLTDEETEAYRNCEGKELSTWRLEWAKKQFKNYVVEQKHSEDQVQPFFKTANEIIEAVPVEAAFWGQGNPVAGMSFA